MAEQMGLDFGDEDSKKQTKADEARKKAREFVSSDPEYAKKLEKREEAKRQDEAMREKVKEMAAKRAALAQSSMISPSGNTTAAGRGETSKGGGGGGAGIPKVGPKKPLDMKKGGKVSSKLKSAGFYDKDKTTSERKKIVSKVTTKPQRVAMVEKLFSAKKMKAGGMASKRADGIAIKGKTRA